MTFTHPHFAEPRWLWLAVMGPVLLFLLLRYAAWARGRQMAAMADPDLLAGLLRSHSRIRRALKNALLVLAVTGIGLALARPQWGEQAEETHLVGEDILFMLDCSRSMLATDVRPNRLERAKLAILDFVERHGGGRIGLVAFAGEAFLQCPLTFDYEAFRETLTGVQDQTIPVPGTDIGRGLEEALVAMEKDERRKIMVLVSDGEDLEKAGVKTAKVLAEKGVIVYTVGVGTAAGTPIQVVNERGQTETMRERDGRVVLSRLDEGTLRAIAEATKGRYYPLGAIGEGMSRVRRMVEALAEQPRQSRSKRLGIDRFHWVIAGVLVLMVGESLIGTRRKSRETTVT